MHTWNTSGSPWLRRGLLLGAVVAALALAACGSSSSGSGSSGNAQTLLKQTFASRQARQERRPGHQLHAEPLGVEHLHHADQLQHQRPLPEPRRRPAASVELHHRRSRRSAARASWASSPRAPAATSPSRAPPTSCPRLTSSAWSRASPRWAGPARAAAACRRLGINPQHWLTNASVVGVGHRRRHRHHPHPRRRQRLRSARRTSTRSWARRRAPRAPSSRAPSRRRPSRRSRRRSRTPPSTSGRARATRSCASSR